MFEIFHFIIKKAIKDNTGIIERIAHIKTLFRISFIEKDLTKTLINNNIDTTNWIIAKIVINVPKIQNKNFLAFSISLVFTVAAIIKTKRDVTTIKIFARNIFDKGLNSRVHKGHIQPNIKNSS